MKGFVKFPDIVFSKARLHNWARKKYVTSENKAQDKVDASFYKYATLYATGRERKAKKMDNTYHFDPVSNTLYNLIKFFTYKETDKPAIENLISTLLIADIKVQIEGDVLHVSSNEMSFDIDKPSRGGKCHPYGVLATIFYSKTDDFDTYFVTGRIYQLSPEAKYLHSWVEVLFNGEVYVIDPTRNAVMPRDAFYKINHVDETVRLHSSEVVKDYRIIRKLTDYDNYAVKVYYENPERGRKLYNMLVRMGEIIEEKDMENSLLK